MKIVNGEIQRKSSTKFLGIHMDKKLDWYEQIDHVKNKMSSSLFTLNRVLPLKTNFWAGTHKTFIIRLIVLMKISITCITR